MSKIITNLAPRINLLHNAGFPFSQRHNGPIALPGTINYSTVDRWQVGFNAPLTAATSQKAVSGPDSISELSLQLNGNSPAGTGSLIAQQFIEANDSWEWRGETVSFSIWVNSNSASDVTIALGYPTVRNVFTTLTGTYGATKVTQWDGVWREIKFENIVLPDTSNGFWIRVSLDNFQVTGSTQSHFITGAMLSLGALALPFRKIGTQEQELAVLQRYFEKSYGPPTNPGTVTTAGAASWRASTTVGSQIIGQDTYKVTKFKIPQVAIYSYTTLNKIGFVRDIDGSADIVGGSVWEGLNKHSVFCNVIDTRRYGWHWTSDSDIV